MAWFSVRKKGEKAGGNPDAPIKVLGSGCKSCHTLFENTRQAVEAAGLSADVEYVTEMQRIAQYGVMRMPALVICGQVVSGGAVLKPAEIEEILRKWAAEGKLS